jgi:hypothetical protein
LFSDKVDWTGAAEGKTDDAITIIGTLQPKPGYRINWIAHQPPLYYLVLLPIYSFLQSQNVVFVTMILRLISVLMAASSLYFIFETIKKLQPQNKILPTAVTCAIAFLPTFSFISAMISNDNLMDLLASVLIYLLIARREQQKNMTKWSIITGVVLALLALTKIHCLVLFFVVLIIQIMDFFKAKEPAKRKSVIYSTIIVFIIPLAFAGWWYFRNFMQYGTFFATLRNAVAVNPQIIKSFPAMVKEFPDIDPSATTKLGLVDFFISKNFFIVFYKNIWGSFGFIEIMTKWQYLGIFAFSLVGVIGQMKNIFLKKISKVKEFKRLCNFLASGQGILFLTFAILLFFLTLEIYKMSSLWGNLGTAHGRYFLAATPALLYMLLRGWEYLAGVKWFEKTAIALVILFMLNEAVSLLYIVIPNS